MTERTITMLAVELVDDLFGVSPTDGWVVATGPDARAALYARAQSWLEAHSRCTWPECEDAMQDATKRAYTAGRRDGLAVATHQNELVRDVLREAARCTEYAGSADLDRAVDAWRDAGMPGLREERAQKAIGRTP